MNYKQLSIIPKMMNTDDTNFNYQNVIIQYLFIN